MRGLGVGIIVTALLMGVATGKGIPLSDAEIKAKALELGMVESDSIRLTDLTNGSPAPEGSGLPGEEGEAVSNGAGTSGDGRDDGIDEFGDRSHPSESADNPEDDSGAGASSNGSGEGMSGSAMESEAQAGTDNASESGVPSNQDTPAGAESGNVPSDTGGQGGEGSSSGENGEDRSQAGEAAVTVVIEFGVTSSHVSEILEEAGLVEDATEFDNYLCNNGYSRSITAGTYEIVPGTSEEEIVKIITKTR